MTTASYPKSGQRSRKKGGDGVLYTHRKASIDEPCQFPGGVSTSRVLTNNYKQGS